ncbi:MAG: M14 family metallopeptidase [Candidatus Paceibacterota bacterium]
MKKIITIIIIGAIIIGGIYFLTKGSSVTIEGTTPQEGVVNGEDNTTTTPGTDEGATTTPDVVVDDTKTVIGASALGNDITAYHYGNGDRDILFVGGIHGGYSWNTSLVAYNLMDYLEANPNSIPNNVRVTVIPVMNPDGLEKVVGTTGSFTVGDVSSSESVKVSGRFNGNTVDLNRNFDCDWQSSATWQSRTVSGGSSAFSEPESLAIKTYIESNTPDAVVVYYSAAGGVFSSSCHNGVSSETRALTQVYAKASGYPAYEEFDFYEITGDMVNWLAKENIPAISVLLTNHTDVEWSKNRAGIEALFTHLSK